MYYHVMESSLGNYILRGMNPDAFTWGAGMTNMIVYQLLYGALLYLVLSSIVSSVRNRSHLPNTPTWYLTLGATLAFCTAACLPFMSRLFTSSSLMLPWECETVIHQFEAYQRDQSIPEFAQESLQRNPGLLSTSGHSLLYGIPTFAIFKTFGWNTTSLRLAAYILGLTTLILGFITIRALFNTGVALIFTTMLATNPLLIFYMGYGVSQTATVCGFFAALAFTVHALKSSSRTRFLWAALAGLLLFMATFNYAPARIFVIATIAFLGIYASTALRIPDSSGRSRVVAVMIILIATGLYFAEKRINPSSDFTTVRGEQAFVMLNHRDQLEHYLKEDPEVRSLPPGPVPFGIKAKFLLAVVSERIREFINHYSPLDQLQTYHARGSQHGDGFRPYQSALIIPMIVGLIAGVRTWRTRSSLLLFCLFLLGLAPLLLTNRVDNHRSLLLLFPLTAWAANGAWILLQRLRGSWLSELHAGIIWSVATIAMMLNAWFFMGAPDPVDQGAEQLLSRSSSYIDTGATIIPTMLNCQNLAMLELKLAEAKRVAKHGDVTLWSIEVGEQLIDGRFRTESPELLRIMESAANTPVVIVSAVPLNKFNDWAQQSPLQSTEEREGHFSFTTLTKR